MLRGSVRFDPRHRAALRRRLPSAQDQRALATRQVERELSPAAADGPAPREAAQRSKGRVGGQALVASLTPCAVASHVVGPAKPLQPA